MDVIVAALQGGVVPGEDLVEGAALFVLALFLRVVKPYEHGLRAGSHLDGLLFGKSEWW